jgi:hypothetical protein
MAWVAYKIVDGVMTGLKLVTRVTPRNHTFYAYEIVDGKLVKGSIKDPDSEYTFIVVDPQRKVTPAIDFYVNSSKHFKLDWNWIKETLMGNKKTTAGLINHVFELGLKYPTDAAVLVTLKDNRAKNQLDALKKEYVNSMKKA